MTTQLDEVKTDGAAVVADPTMATSASPDKTKTIPSLGEYVKRVRKMKMGVCYDQPWLNPTPVTPPKQ